MDTIESILGSIDGGRVLDVATQEGHFAQILINHLKSWSSLTGIDINEQAIETARSKLALENARFLVMDAEDLEFEDESFDTVNISASLHHVANIPRVLNEMGRVVKHGGRFIIVEMHRDGQTEAELTSVYLHQWVAEVDTALNHLHNKTLARQEFVDYAGRLGLREVGYYDFRDTDSDPDEKTRIEQLEALVERTIQRAEDTGSYAALKARGEELRRRLHRVGAQREPILMIVGKK